MFTTPNLDDYKINAPNCGALNFFGLSNLWDVSIANESIEQ
jgi:hypothetical protein